jgi:ferredoxin-NADP reductase
MKQKIFKRFFVEVKELEKYEFKAGQYVRLDLPVTYKKGIRYYSFANAAFILGLTASF